MFRPESDGAGADVLRGAHIREVFSQELLDDLAPMIRKADRMGTTTSQMEVPAHAQNLSMAVTVASLKNGLQRQGYVMVLEDLSDLLTAQKQAAWREVARRVAHEIKNPLTPIALSAQRIKRHIEKARDSRRRLAGRNSADVPTPSLGPLRRCERWLTSSQPWRASLLRRLRPADINQIVGERPRDVRRSP